MSWIKKTILHLQGKDLAVSPVLTYVRCFCLVQKLHALGLVYYLLETSNPQPVLLLYAGLWSWVNTWLIPRVSEYLQRYFDSSKANCTCACCFADVRSPVLNSTSLLSYSYLVVLLTCCQDRLRPEV